MADKLERKFWYQGWWKSLLCEYKSKLFWITLEIIASMRGMIKRRISNSSIKISKKDRLLFLHFLRLSHNTLRYPWTCMSYTMSNLKIVYQDNKTIRNLRRNVRKKMFAVIHRYNFANILRCQTFVGAAVQSIYIGLLWIIY